MEYKTISNFARLKGVSKQRIHELVELGRFDILEIDGVRFIVLNEKAANYRK